MAEFQIDMNGCQDGRVGTLLKHSTSPLQTQVYPPKVGEWVTAVDETGNRWAATVERIEPSGWLLLHLRWVIEPAFRNVLITCTVGGPDA